MARKKVAPGTRRRVLERDGHRCVECGATPEALEFGLELDHIVPVVLGGRSTFDNLQTLCQPCNLRKGPRPTREWAVV